MLVADLMSGTSADGIDVALVEITGLEWQTRIRVRAIHFVPYPPAVRRRILKIAGGSSLPASEISQMNCLLGELFARACLKACRQAGIPKKRLGLIGSHGQTVYHQNEVSRYCEMPVRSTFQIGEPAVIAERTGVTTIGDFRTADVAAGGRGAPLVPYLDYRLYRHPRRGRVVINIGGIANLTAIPAGGTPEEVIAFDTGPGNMLLDALAELATKGKQHYDAAGKLAAQGTISETLVRRLLRRAYFRLPPPKTTGREQFGRDYLKRFLATGKFNSSRNRRKGRAGHRHGPDGGIDRAQRQKIRSAKVSASRLHCFRRRSKKSISDEGAAAAVKRRPGKGKRGTSGFHIGFHRHPLRRQGGRLPLPYWPITR